MVNTQAQHPLFERFSVSDLAARGLGGEFYLMELKSGYKPVRPGFKKKAARLLMEPETALFVAQTQEQGDASTEEETHGDKERNERSGRG